MKFKMLAKKLGCALALPTLMSSPVVLGAEGVPTIDLLLHDILKDTSKNQIAELQNLYRRLDDQYKKVKAEYEHLQRVAQGLKTLAKDPEQLKRLAYERLATSRSVYEDIQLYDKNGVYNADEGIKRLYQRTLGTSEVGRQMIPDRYRNKGFTTAMREKELTNYNQAFQRSRLADLHAKDTRDIGKDLKVLGEKSTRLENMREMVATQDNNELATLQLMALQNQHMFENLQALQKIQKKQFEHSNKLADFIFAKQARGSLERIERIQRALNQPPTKIDNTGRW
ncbi:hypothetical protein [Zooshikella ganghwensis]|uniref:P-type DNA transfer protein VirB5 n=1 Tax=Zooshikella ganghwensis TaxID=202772 RepID=A0A4V1IMT3_9GAMM|nr:hypothetical protein [Zooshikella ganghwensis]RDH41331.1 hypothetical protein B9G39_29110 [Zooshikella ganghwensis]